MKAIPFAIIGGGWRAEFYLRIAAELPAHYKVCAVCEPDKSRAEQLANEWEVTIYADLESLARAQKPVFVVLCLPQNLLPEAARQAVSLGLPVLCETSFANDLASLVNEYETLGASGLVQVAEQYPLQSIHAARLAVIVSGVLGQVNQVQLSVAHGYHATSLLRHYLGKWYDECTVQARMFDMPVIEGPGRPGYPAAEHHIRVPQLLGHFDFGDSWGGVDFADEQYFSPVLGMRVLVRGERGEIDGDIVRYYKTFKEPVSFPLRRVAGGAYGSMRAPSVEGIQGGLDWYYRNPFPGARLSDEEIALAQLLSKMVHFVENGDECYSFASACQDRYLALLLQESAQTGKPVKAIKQAWCC